MSELKLIPQIAQYAKSAENLYMDKFLPSDFYKKIAAGKTNRQLFPKFSDRAAWENIRQHKNKQNFCEEILDGAEACLNKPPCKLTSEMFQEYAVNGNRVHYEGGYFANRNRLANLVVAMCLSGETEPWMCGILTYIDAIIAEPLWCIPAHCTWSGNTPLEPECQADLFACETGALMAYTINLIGDELETARPGLTDKIRKMVWDRVINRVLKEKTSPHCWWYHSAKPMNWTIWCCYNCITCILCLEQNPQRAAELVRVFLYPVSRYIVRYPDDGYCDEGAGYYFKSALMLCKLAQSFEAIQPHSMDKFFAEPKHVAMFQYIIEMLIGGDRVAYADGHPETGGEKMFIKLLSCALSCKSDRFIAQCKVKQIPPFLSGGASKKHLLKARFNHLNLVIYDLLDLLFNIPGEIPSPRKTIHPLTYYKNNLAIVRSSRFSTSLKAGHNAENHNHNDLGHFTVYYGQKPVVFDAGTDSYGKINFSKERYTLWYTRGSGHNAPVFGEAEQVFGGRYTATLPKPEKIKGGYILSTDLSKAYPETVGVKSLLRTITATDSRVTVTDKATLKSPLPVTINLIAVQKPVKCDGDRVKIGDVYITWNGLNFGEIRQEEFPVSGKKFYRIVLQTQAEKIQEYEIYFAEK